MRLPCTVLVVVATALPIALPIGLVGLVGLVGLTGLAGAPGEARAAPTASAPSADSPGEGEGQGGVENARRAHAFVRTIMSPFCPGRTLTDCPSPDAAALRDEIRVQLDSGVSQDVILEQLGQRFGDAIVGVPRSAWGWTLPVLLLVAGAGALIAALRSLSSRSSQAVPSDASEPRGEPGPQPVRSDLADDLDAEIESRGL
ncbi:MAG: cytochrome c-type biogenesis protein CcmH [Deltaproteobacteria bacterium]|nr:cytochrome c-type biogenesis protein CcmH [Deltaproteobacteria bacterium]MBW2413073.1 cytochrome c-type biogenesis protein CcmH [Deltaproteobacteria bacterium]